MRVKEIYSFKRPKIPVITEVATGEEMSLKLVLFCTREEMKEIISVVAAFGTSKKE